MGPPGGGLAAYMGIPQHPPYLLTHPTQTSTLTLQVLLIHQHFFKSNLVSLQPRQKLIGAGNANIILKGFFFY